MTGASHLSPDLGSRMQAVEITGKPVFVRELLPQDLKIEMNALDRKEAARVAGYLAGSWERPWAANAARPTKGLV
jgi:uncharacterized protein (DUF2252 family)